MIINCAGIEKYFGGQTVLQGLNWGIPQGRKIGLIGPNGAGKSTLMRIICGEEVPDGGSVYRLPGLRIGYLAQTPILQESRTVIQEVLSGSATLGELELEMRRLEHQMSDPQVYSNEQRLARTLEQHEHIVRRFEALGGLTFESRVQSTLRGLGFQDADFELEIRVLSGGQKKLVGLAKLLVDRPDLLLLDEPDNHLDVDGKTFLEQIINDYEGTVVIISHDRYLLDVVAEEIVELENGAVELYTGNYSEYAFVKNTMQRRQEQMYHVQQKEIIRLEEAVRRLMGWGAGQNEKLVKRARSMQKRIDKIERIDKPVERKTMGLELNATRGSDKVLELSHLAKTFPAEPDKGIEENPVLEDVNLLVWNGERVGLVGPNGAGKTVVFRCVLGELEPDSGTITLGPSIQAGYYAQEHQTLDFDSTPLEEIRSLKPMYEREAYGFLGRFLFSFDDAHKPVKVLSGGEKSRLQLAKLMLGSANFLLLDEPTNNLDIQSAEALEDTLLDYSGSILMISHDRYFLDRVATRIVELRGGVAENFNGGYSYYREQKARQEQQAAEKARQLEVARKSLAERRPDGPARGKAAGEKGPGEISYREKKRREAGLAELEQSRAAKKKAGKGSKR